MASTVQLAFENVTMGFAGETLFNQVQLQVLSGESLVLIGPSGEGKTVILKLLAGLLEPLSGAVVINGRRLSEMSERERERLRLGMGMLFQRNALFDSLTVAENIAFPLREKTQLTASETDERVAYFLEQVGLTGFDQLFPDEISGGMQKRLGIARALALKPQIVLYDDPTAGLDPITSRRIVDLIIQLKKENGSTVIAVTNDMVRAYQLGDRLAMVIDGEILVTGTKSETLLNRDPRVHQFIRGRLDGPITAGA